MHSFHYSSPMLSNAGVKYHFGRINVRGPENPNSVIQTALQNHVLLDTGAINWGFFDTGALEAQQPPILHGYLTKYRTVAEEEVAVTESGTIDQAQLENQVIAKARFFLDLSSHIIAFNNPRAQIKDQTFSRKFIDLIREAHEGILLDGEIDLINETDDIFAKMRAMDIIDTLQFDLIPTNPSNSEAYREFDERLKIRKAAKYKEIHIAQEGQSLEILEDPELVGKIHMASDGYGTASAKGIKNGKPTIVSTKDAPLTALAPGDDTPARETFEFLEDEFKRIMERTHGQK